MESKIFSKFLSISFLIFKAIELKLNSKVFSNITNNLQGEFYLIQYFCKINENKQKFVSNY